MFKLPQKTEGLTITVLCSELHHFRNSFSYFGDPDYEHVFRFNDPVTAQQFFKQLKQEILISEDAFISSTEDGVRLQRYCLKIIGDYSDYTDLELAEFYTNHDLVLRLDSCYSTYMNNQKTAL